MIFRVGLGALLSTTDSVTDVYVILTYYENTDLIMQANVLLAMIMLSLLSQLMTVYVQNKKKSLPVKLKECMITVLFLRPAIDAYRVSTNHDDDETPLDPLSEMVMNEARE